jgi:hypothetical protein
MNVLKGQNNLAQGKRRRSVALGFRTGEKIVREITLIKGFHCFGRKGMNSNSVRKEFFSLIIVFARTVFPLFLLPQALPGARICWPFRPKLMYEKA